MAPAAELARRALQQALAREGRRIVARLARRLGLAHLALAEDALQVAGLRALHVWTEQGLPARPGGWLYEVARHEAIDQLRRASREQPWPDDDESAAAEGSRLAGLTEGATATANPGGRFAGELDDDELALLFAACHPRLPLASQVTLALRLATALDLALLAEGLFSTPAALAQRLARAREALATESLELPAGDALPPRREAVLTVLSVMFRCGLRAPDLPAGGGDAGPLCWEAIRLARALAAHRATAHPDADALAATLLLHGARLTGRFDEEGDIVPLPGQPRDRWDAGMVRMGLAHLQAAQRGARLSRWHLMAGIAAVHATAPDAAGTDWAAIVRYYELLLVIDPSPAPRLAHAIALAEAGAPALAREKLDALLPTVPPGLRAHALAALARAHEREGDEDLARRRLAQAIDCAPGGATGADGRLLARRLEGLGPG